MATAERLLTAEEFARMPEPAPLIKETKPPIEPTLEHGRRVHHEYERAGTANIFKFTEPLAA